MDEAIKYRVSNGIERDDFLAHIISLRKKKNISDIEMASHGVTFFLGKKSQIETNRKLKIASCK
jgi:cytochrome P450 family 28